MFIIRQPKISVASGPQFDAIGAGQKITAGSTMSFSHTLVASGYVLVSYGCHNGSTPTTTATCGGTSMTKLGTSPLSSNSFLVFFGLAGVSSGTKTIALAAATTAAAANSISLTGVTSAATPVFTASGTFSQNITCTAGQLIVQSFEEARDGDISAYSGGTKRWTDSAGAGTLTLSTATATTTFTATTVNGQGCGGGVVFS